MIQGATERRFMNKKTWRWLIVLLAKLLPLNPTKEGFELNRHWTIHQNEYGIGCEWCNSFKIMSLKSIDLLHKLFEQENNMN
jgi:hypothetical protein